MMDDRGCCPRSTSRVSLIRECHHSGQVNHLLTHGQSPQRPAPVFFVRFHTRRGFPRLSPRTKILQGVQGCLSSRSLVSWHKIIHVFSWCSATTQLSTAVQWGASMFPQASLECSHTCLPRHAQDNPGTALGIPAWVTGMEFDEHFLCFKIDYAFTLKTGICAFHSEDFFAFLLSLDRASQPWVLWLGKESKLYLFN